MVQNCLSGGHILLCGIILSIVYIPVKSEVFLNKWAVHVDGGEDAAREVAAKHGFSMVGQVSGLIYFSKTFCSAKVTHEDLER